MIFVESVLTLGFSSSPDGVFEVAEKSEFIDYVLGFNFCPPLLSVFCPTDSDDAGRIPGRHRHVLIVIGPRNVAQVREPIIVGLAIDVIYDARGPRAVIDAPCDAVDGISAAFIAPPERGAEVSEFIAASYFHGSSVQEACFGIVAKPLADDFRRREFHLVPASRR